jgi:hypothetical protein
MANGVQIELLMGQIVDTDGSPLVGGKVYTYDAGTLTPKSVYTDVTQFSAATNPVILDSAGRKLVYATGDYKFVITRSDDTSVVTLDNLNFAYPDLSAGFGVNVDLNGFRITDVGVPTTLTEWTRRDQELANSIRYGATSSGAGNTYTMQTVASVSAITYTAGQIFMFIADKTNTGNATLNVNGTGAKSIMKANGSDNVGPGQIQIGQLVRVWYDGTNFRVIAPEAGWVSWTPTISSPTGTVISATSIIRAVYKLGDDYADIDLSFTVTTATTDTNELDASLPAAIAPFAIVQASGCQVQRGAATVIGGFVRVDNTPKVGFFGYDAGLFGLGTLRGGAWTGRIELA